MKRNRNPQGEKTYQKILKTGIALWLQNPDNVSALSISTRIGISHATVLYHFPYGVKDAVAEHAVEIKNARIIAQLIASGHAAIRDMSPTERTMYLKSI